MQHTIDTLTSLVNGMGNPSRDKLAAAFYGGSTLGDQEITNAYRTNWMAKRLVNIPAKDALRNWRIWQAKPEQINAIEAQELRLSLQGKLLECLKIARAQGGAALFIGTGDNKLGEPMNINRIGKDGIKYLTIMPRTSLIAGDLDSNVLSANYGKPAFYEVATDTSLVKIHPSRLVVFIGEPHVDNWAVHGVNRGWGDSIIQASYDALKHSGSADANVASLIFEANINVLSIPDLMSKLESDSETNAIMKRLQLAAAAKGIHGDLLLDAEEQHSRQSANFTNLDKIMQHFATIVGATQGIPASKFLGLAAAGLNSTGEHELKNYYDDIKTMQTLEIQPAMQVLDECLIRSALGSRPSEISYLWSPLMQPSSSEIAETGEKLANSARTLAESGLYEAQELREAFTNQFVNHDVLPNLGDVLKASNDALDDDLGLDDDEV